MTSVSNPDIVQRERDPSDECFLPPDRIAIQQQNTTPNTAFRLAYAPVNSRMRDWPRAGSTMANRNQQGRHPDGNPDYCG